MKTRRVGTHRRRHRIVVAPLAIGAAYLGGYIVYRQTHVEVWANDGKPYVIFDSMPAYYAFRPLSRIDAALTRTGAHIGPHR